MLQLKALPSDVGDAIIVEYGDGDRTRRILVDGGPHESYQELRKEMLKLPANDRHFELLIITHVDKDHVEGLIRLLLDQSLGCSFGDIWLNDWPQLASLADNYQGKLVAGFGGEKQGFKFLSCLIEDLNLACNESWQGGPVVVPPTGPLVMHEFAGGLRITLLSPEIDGLFKLHRYWSDVAGAAGFTLGEEKDVLRQLRALKDRPSVRTRLPLSEKSRRLDASVANLSSIAILAEHGRQRILLTGDAHPRPLVRSLKRWMATKRRGFVYLNAFKLPHHGSKANVSRELLRLIRCRHYVVSTNGMLYGHPNPETFSLILTHHQARWAPVFHFNYRTQATVGWVNHLDDKYHGYRLVYPTADSSGCTVPAKRKRPSLT